MSMRKIASRRDPLVRDAAALGRDAALRRSTGAFLCEGARLCRDAARSGLAVERCFFTPRAREKYGEYLEEMLPACGEAVEIAEHIAPLLSDTKTPQGIFCVCRRQEDLHRGLIGFAPKGPCLVLENLQDPGNLGTVLRTAEALGVSRVFLLGDCCDPWSPKALRASMGAVFRLSLMEGGSAEELCKLLRGQGCRLHAAVPRPDAVPVTELVLSQDLHAVFIGNEGSGLREETVALCDDAVVIPMAGRAESLNASAAATILLWEMCRGLAEGRRCADG